MKIFIFGSCRTNYLQTNNKYTVIRNIDCIHSTKEILQYLDFFDNKKNVLEALYPSGIIDNDSLDKFNSNYYKKELEESDIVIIELSSINSYYDKKKYYYQLDRISKIKNLSKSEWVDKESNFHDVLKEEDIYNDMITIQSRINKPIIYQGHINFYFDNYEPLKNKNYVMNERQIIDNAIIKYENKYSIIYRDVFKNYNWRDILLSENDLHHLNSFGMNILKEYVEKRIL
jgi:hypothetical protein